ncbi:MAG: Hpt domain-containing protein, partial [Betaproteobacteria bacterium]|nr:Hpt domain-containing protein [Betaproteobacteria bacterium]
MYQTKTAMATSNDEFLTKLLAIFQVEADEHIQAMSSGLFELEKIAAGEQRSECVERIYREAHSLKGAARAVNVENMESVCHALESVFAELKNNRIVATLPLFDLLHQTLGALRGLVASIDQPTKAETQSHAVVALVHRLEGALTDTPPTMQGVTSQASAVPDQVAASPGPGGAVPQISSLGSKTIRVRTVKLDSVMRQAEELLAPQLAASERARELRGLGNTLATWKKELAKVQPAMRAVERSFGRGEKTSGNAKGQRDLTKLLEYLDAEPPLLKLLENRLTKLEKSTAHDQRTLSGLVDGLLRDVKEMHMLSFSSLLEAFPRLARELARDQGKQVELVIRGDEIEIDRRILEQIKDPLNHLLRNCVDHGVEKPVVREQKGKPAHATLTIAVAYKDASKIEILVADDGAGIDVAKVKVAAIRLGVVSAEELETLNEHDALMLVFQSGISTSPIVTDLSGRGLGLAIVRERVERLGGTIALETEPGRGTSFRIVLPLTLATFRGVLVRAGDRMFIIPAVSVERVALVADSDIRTVENRETIALDDRALSLVHLADVLEIPRAP